MDEFRELSKHLAFTEAQQRAAFFQQQLEESKDNLANAEEALKRTEQTTGLIQLDSQAKALIESAAELRAQIAAKEVQIQAMQTYATGENAQVIQAQQELESMRGQLAQLGGSDESANSLIVPKGKVPEAGLEYVRKLRDVKYYETIFDILARQFEIAKLDEAKRRRDRSGGRSSHSSGQEVFSEADDHHPDRYRRRLVPGNSGRSAPGGLGSSEGRSRSRREARSASPLFAQQRPSGGLRN